MKVDLPTPGTPDMPTRQAFPELGSTRSSSSAALTRWSGRVDSTRVMALASAARSPPMTASASERMSVRSASAAVDGVSRSAGSVTVRTVRRGGRGGPRRSPR